MLFLILEWWVSLWLRLWVAHVETLWIDWARCKPCAVGRCVMNRLRFSSFFSLANGREKNAFSFVCVNGDTRLHILARALCGRRLASLNHCCKGRETFDSLQIILGLFCVHLMRLQQICYTLQHIFACSVEKCLKNRCFSSETRGRMKKIGLLLRLRETYCPRKMELVVYYSF